MYILGMQLPLSQVKRSPKQVRPSDLQYSGGSSLPSPQSVSPSQYQVAGMHLWFGQRKLFGGQVRCAQCKGSSSLLSPQSLSPSHNQYGSTQMLVFSHLRWLAGQVVLRGQRSSASSDVLLSLQSLIPLQTFKQSDTKLDQKFKTGLKEIKNFSLLN
jgi:hypothetical protein